MSAHEPAFPPSRRQWTGDDKNGSYEEITSGGLTKLEYFAGLAMQGRCVSVNVTPEELAVLSVRIARALIAELEKETQR